MKNIKPLILEPDIKKQVSAIACKLSKDYKGKDLMLIGILKAAWIFTADLMREITIPVTCDFIRAKSYADDKSSGSVELIWDVKRGMVFGKDILLVDTVLDTGLSMSYIIDHLKKFKPNSIKVCVLVNKSKNRKTEIFADYVGFWMKNEFIVGYGLDFNDNYRNLKFIGTEKS